MAHTHTTNIRSVNNTLVCDECAKEEDKNGNECFCKCHKELKDNCSKCKMFHTQ